MERCLIDKSQLEGIRSRGRGLYSMIKYGGAFIGRKKLSNTKRISSAIYLLFLDLLLPPRPRTRTLHPTRQI